MLVVPGVDGLVTLLLVVNIENIKVHFSAHLLPLFAPLFLVGLSYVQV